MRRGRLNEKRARRPSLGGVPQSAPGKLLFAPPPDFPGRDLGSMMAERRVLSSPPAGDLRGETKGGERGRPVSPAKPESRSARRQGCGGDAAMPWKRANPSARRRPVRGPGRPRAAGPHRGGREHRAACARASPTSSCDGDRRASPAGSNPQLRLAALARRRARAAARTRDRLSSSPTAPRRPSATRCSRSARRRACRRRRRRATSSARSTSPHAGCTCCQDGARVGLTTSRRGRSCSPRARPTC